MTASPSTSLALPDDPSSAFIPVDAPVPGGPLGGTRRLCHAHNRQGNPCGRHSAPNQNVCASHGAKSPQAIAAAKRRAVEANAAALVAREGYAPLDDPVEALLSTAGEMIALKDAMADQVSRLEDMTTTDRMGAENVSAVLAAYERGLERVAHTLTAINRLDIMARRVNVEQVQAELLVEALKRAVHDPVARLTYDQAQAVLAAADAEFRALMS